MRQLSERVTFLRESYELVAQMFAAGMTPSMISRRTGYSRRRLNLLWHDPTFQERYQQYRAKATEALELAADEFQALMQHNMLVAERQIRDKLDEADMNEEFLPTRELIAIVADRADRNGYSKRAINTNINIDFASALDRAIERSGKGKLIEAQAHPIGQLPDPSIEQVEPSVSTTQTVRTPPARPTLSSTFKRRF